MSNLGMLIDVTSQTVLRELRDLEFMLYLQLLSCGVNPHLEAVMDHVRERIKAYDGDLEYE